MTSVTKLGLVAAALGGAYWLISQAKSAASNFIVEIVSFARPALRGYNLTIPLTLRFTNPSPVPISLDRFYADVYVRKGSKYVKAGTVNEPLAIAAGVSEALVKPIVNLDKIFGGNVLETTAFLAEISVTKQVNVRIDYSITVKGVQVYTSSKSETLYLA